MSYKILGTNQPTDLEAAAIGAALTVLLAATSAPAEPARPNNLWDDAARLSRQGLRPARTGVRPRWHTIERLRVRAAGGFYGITGM